MKIARCDHWVVNDARRGILVKGVYVENSKQPRKSSIFFEAICNEHEDNITYVYRETALAIVSEQVARTVWSYIQPHNP
jgi:hypothetical protein